MVPKDARQQFPPSLESRPLARASWKPQLPWRCLRAAPCSSRAQTLPFQLQEPPVPLVSQTLPQTRIHRELLHIPRLSDRHSKQDVSRTRASFFSYTPPRLPVSPPGTKLPQLPVTSVPTLTSVITTSKWQSHPLAPLQPLQWPAAATWALLASPA